MKSKFITFLFCCVILSMAACKKDLKIPGGLTNITVVHALTDVPTLLVNTSGKAGVWNTLNNSYTGKVAYGASLGNPVQISIAKNLKIASATDTLGSIYHAPPDFSPLAGDIYTLLIFGGAQTPQSVLIKENLTARADSTTGVRFINLVQNSKPIKVNIQNSTTTEADNLGYKSYSDFKGYDAKSKHPNYVFEFRDVATNNLLFSYVYVVARTYNVSLVLRGIAGGTGTNAIAVTRVNHY